MLDEVRPPVQLGPFMCQSEESMNCFCACLLIVLLFFVLLVMQGNIRTKQREIHCAEAMSHFVSCTAHDHNHKLC